MMQNLGKRLRGHLNRSRIVLYGLGLQVMAFSLAGVGNSALRMIYLVLGFSLIIFLHELGHFVVARSCSVKCLAFSLGIGPRAVGWRKGAGLTFGPDRFDPEYKKKPAKGAEPQVAPAQSDLPTTATEPARSPNIGVTDYRLSWLPLGGYVRMLGQDDMDPTKVSRDPFAFNMRPIWQRMCIVSAGVIMNVIFALVAFTIIFRVGVNFPPAYVGQVVYDSPADKAGLQMGDQIVSINNWKPHGFLEFTDVVIESALSSGNEPMSVEWIRPSTGEHFKKPIVPMKPPSGDGFLMIGIEQMPSLTITTSEDNLAEHAERRGKPLAEGGLNDPEGAKQEADHLRPGDTIIQANGQDVADYLQLYNLVQQAGDKPVTLTVRSKDGSTTRECVLTPQLAKRDGVSDYPEIFGMGPRTKAGEVTKGDPADKAGIKEGDEIARVDAQTWPTKQQMIDIISKMPGKVVEIAVLRGGEEKTFKVKVAKKDGEGKIGVPLLDATDDTAMVLYGGGSSPVAEVTNLNEPMRIASVDGQPVKSWDNIFTILKRKHAGDSVAIGFLPAAAGTSTAPAAAKEKTFIVDATLASSLDKQLNFMLNIPVDFVTLTQKADNGNSAEAAMMGLEHTKKFILQVYMTLAGLVRRTISPSNLHGIVGIAKIGYEIQERGMAWFWYLMGIVSINLAVVNFLPLPIVDGGLFLLLILEKIRGKPLSLKVQSVIQIVGIVVLAGLFIFVTFNDIKLFK